MTLFALLAELARVLLVALDAVWIVALGQMLGGLPHGLEPWLALSLVGGLMVAVERLPSWYGREGGAVGRLGALLVALLPLSWLMARYAPALVGGWIAGPAEWAAALVAVWNHPGNYPLTVIALAGLLLWWRSGRIAHAAIGQQIILARSQRAALLLVGLLVWGALGGVRFSAWLGGALGLCILLALALARLRATIANPALTAQRPPLRRLGGTLLLSTVGSLLAALLVGLIVARALLPALAFLLAPIATPIGRVGALVLDWLIALLTSLIGEREVELGEVAPFATPQASAPLPEDLPFEHPSATGGVPIAPLITVALLLLLFFLLLRWRAARRVEEGAAPSSAATEGAGGLGAWLRERLSRPMAGRRPRRAFGSETIRDLYGALLLFGDDHGVPRPVGDTPYEYLAPLADRYPARRGDLVALTDAYVSLRYGERPAGPGELDALRAALRRIEQAGAEGAGKGNTGARP